MVRNVLIVVASIIIGSIAVKILEIPSSLAFPMTEEVMKDPEAMAKFMDSLPIWAFVMVALAHFSGVFFAGFAGFKISKGKKWMAIIPAGVMVFMTVLNIFMVGSHPSWFIGVDITLSSFGMYLIVLLYGNKE